MPEVYKQLLGIRKTLEDHYGDMQDIEFTVERGKLWMLQTRTGKRTGFAEVRIAVEMVEEKRITPEQAVLRVNPDSLNQLLRPIFDPAAKDEALDGGPPPRARASTRAPARRRAASSSRRTTPSSGPSAARRCSSCARRRAPRTSRA